jgi:hypothetical protein
MLTRMFAYFTLVMYLFVGTVAVRVLMPETTTVTFSTSYAKYFSKTEIKVTSNEAITAPEMSFAEIKFPVVKKYVAKRVVPQKFVVVDKTPLY